MTCGDQWLVRKTAVALVLASHEGDHRAMCDAPQEVWDWGLGTDLVMALVGLAQSFRAPDDLRSLLLAMEVDSSLSHGEQLIEVAGWCSE